MLTEKQNAIFDRMIELLKAGWTQGAYILTPDGVHANYGLHPAFTNRNFDITGCSFCQAGARRRAMLEVGANLDDSYPTMHSMNRAADCLYGTPDAVWVNDHVISSVDAVIELVEVAREILSHAE